MDRLRHLSPGLKNAALLTGVSLVLALAGRWWRHQTLDAALLRADPAAVLLSPDLIRYASVKALSVYQRHCAGCHRSDRRGDQVRGVPDLADRRWLYGDDLVGIEHTVLYGIRSGHPMARNLTDMPAMVRTGQISSGEARDVVQYLLRISGRHYTAPAAERGRSIYLGKGNCFDCHGADAGGVTDYGTPALTGPGWLYGGDPEMLYQSILNGRHGICPAHISSLSAVEARAVAVYVRMAPNVN